MKKCHDCKSTNVAKILYGYPADMDKWKKDMDSGKFVAGGCVVRDDRCPSSLDLVLHR